MTALRLAHRGDWRVAPENTLAAFRAALDRPGCDGVEFDVRASADGAAVVVHDETLERVQGLPARVAELSAADLSGHGVPTLDTVLAMIDRGAFVDVELKEWVPSALDAIDGARAAASGQLQRTVVSSFGANVHRELRRLRPAWRRWLNVVVLNRTTIDQAHDLGCAGISARWEWIDDQAVRATQAAGLELAAWTVRRKSTYRRLAGLGVVAICAEAAALDG